MTEEEEQAQAASSLPGLRRLAHVLDSSVRLPGGYRIGLDGFIGLVPVAGDALSAVISTWIVVQGARLGASVPTLMRMMMNVLIELVVGVIPVLGDLFDFAWKANNRNVRLLEATLDTAGREQGARRRLGAAVLGLLFLFVVLLLVAIYLALRFFMFLVETVGSVI
ncbi:MAG: hypothetical protein Hals2KO_15930 [Halioglobus sp.]